ncbi:MAG: hypothetical protein FJ246_04635 [Nitrospira sp.]|nr:hypothetical protein [Nitrospira sp.]
MKTLISTVAAVLGVAFSLSVALANPALLPKHPGYPGGDAKSPVTGQPLSNDGGQTNAVGTSALEHSASSVKHAEQHLVDQNNARIVEKDPAHRSDGKFNRLPKVQGPQIKVEPPVESATKITGERTIN